MIIKKKKALNSIKLLFLLGLVGFFLFMSILMTFSDTADLTVRIFGILFFIPALFGIAGIYQFVFKIGSVYPEFELTKDNFVVHDDLKFYKIPWSEINSCRLYYPSRGPTGLLLKLKKGSKIKGNANYFLKKSLKYSNDEDAILLSLEFADIKKDKLIELIEAKINDWSIKHERD